VLLGDLRLLLHNVLASVMVVVRNTRHRLGVKVKAAGKVHAVIGTDKVKLALLIVVARLAHHVFVQAVCGSGSKEIDLARSVLGLVIVKEGFLGRNGLWRRLNAFCLCPNDSGFGFASSVVAEVGNQVCRVSDWRSRNVAAGMEWRACTEGRVLAVRNAVRGVMGLSLMIKVGDVGSCRGHSPGWQMTRRLLRLIEWRNRCKLVTLHRFRFGDRRLGQMDSGVAEVVNLWI